MISCWFKAIKGQNNRSSLIFLWQFVGKIFCTRDNNGLCTVGVKTANKVYPSGQIAEKAVCRKSVELTKTHSLRLFFLQFCPLGFSFVFWIELNFYLWFIFTLLLCSFLGTTCKYHQRKTTCEKAKSDGVNLCGRGTCLSGDNGEGFKCSCPTDVTDTDYCTLTTRYFPPTSFIAMPG